MRKMNTFLLATACLSSALFVGCDYGIEASFNEHLIDKITVGETINFNDYLDYDDSLSISYTYSNEYVTDEAYDSMYFIANVVSMHEFKFSFSDGKHVKKLTCSIDVVPEKPTVVENTNAVYVSKGETVSFESLFERSGIDALPFGNVDIKFTGVTYSADYETENVVLSTNPISSTYTKINNEESFTFSAYGKYIFNLDVYNSQGSVSTSMQVSVFDSYSGTIEGYTFSGLIKGNDNVVSLVKSNISSKLSYLYYENPLTLDVTKKYTMECEFVGKHAPQLILGADTKNGNKFKGNGLVISLEEDAKNQFGIYGYDRLNSANLSPSRSEGNTFSRKNLVDNQKYKWQTIFRLTESANQKKVAIMSYLYKGTSLYRTYNWASISVTNFLDNSYFGYLGSSVDDALFTYNPIVVENV